MEPSEFEKADIVVKEITKGVFKIAKSKLRHYKEESYIENHSLTNLLNAVKIVIVNNDSQVIHRNF